MVFRRENVSRLLPSMEGISGRDLIWLFFISLVLFVALLPFSSYVAALPLIQDEWGLNNTQAGIIFSANLAGYALSALFVIPLTDRIGSKQILITAAIISVISHVLFPLVADGMTSAILLRLIAGVGLVGVYTPGMRIVAERFSKHGRGMAVGFYVTAFYAANSASLAATGALMSRFEWRDAYLIVSLAAVVAVPLAYGLLRNHTHTPAQGSSGRLDLTVLKSRPTRLFVMGYSLHAAELYIVRVWLPVFLVAVLVARGMNNAQAAATAATVAGISLAFGSIGPVMGGILSDRWSRASSAAVIFALSGACSFAIGWMAGFPWGIIIGLTAIYGWAIAADSAIYSTAVTEVADRNKLGSTMAVHSFLGFMGGVISPVVFGGILDLSTESLKWGIGFTFTGTLAIFAIAGLMRLRSSQHVGKVEEQSESVAIQKTG